MFKITNMLFVLLLLSDYMNECLFFSFIMKALFFHNLFKILVTNLALLCVVSFSSLICSCLFCLCFKYICSILIVFQSILVFHILPFYFVACLFMDVSLYMSTACMWRSKDNFVGVYLSYRSCGSSLGRQAWHQMSLHTQPSCLPLFYVFYLIIISFYNILPCSVFLFVFFNFFLIVFWHDLVIIVDIGN